MPTFIDIEPKVLDKLTEFGFRKEATKSPYEVFRLSGPCYAILYHSKKLLLQGKKSSVEEIAKLLKSLGYEEDKKDPKEPEFESEKVTDAISRKSKDTIEIGSDEVLKGDTFGGIVVAAVLASEKEREELKKIGVVDSKELTDFMIKDIAERIKTKIPNDQISVRNLYPKEYNESLEKISRELGNKKSSSTTVLLNRLHEYVQKDLDSRNQFKIDGKKLVHVTDRFPGCTVGDIIEEKAESKYITVAAASILARNAALIQLETLSHELKYRIPKGSTHVKDALEFLKRSGKDPREFVKVDFRNVREFFD